MLSDTDKEKIRHEEIFRMEIRNILAPKTTPFDRFIKVINSAIFIWFLSTIIVGLISVIYARWEKNNLQEKYIIELETEISMRIFAMSIHLDNIAKSDKMTRGALADALSCVLFSPWYNNVPKFAFIPNAFTRYRERNLRSLFWERFSGNPKSEKLNKIITSLNDLDYLVSNWGTFKQKDTLSLELLNEAKRKAEPLQKWLINRT